MDDWLVKQCKLQNVKDFPTVGKYFDKRKVHICADGGAINSIYFEYFGISLENIYKWKVCAVAIGGISFWNFLDFSFDFFYFLQTNWGSFENAFGFVFFSKIF